MKVAPFWPLIHKQYKLKPKKNPILPSWEYNVQFHRIHSFKDKLISRQQEILVTGP